MGQKPGFWGSGAEKNRVFGVILVVFRIFGQNGHFGQNPWNRSRILTWFFKMTKNTKKPVFCTLLVQLLIWNAGFWGYPRFWISWFPRFQKTTFWQKPGFHDITTFYHFLVVLAKTPHFRTMSKSHNNHTLKKGVPKPGFPDPQKPWFLPLFTTFGPFLDP